MASLGRCDACERSPLMPVSDPGMCYKGLSIKRTLGAGDVGVAYELSPGAQNKSLSEAMNPSGSYVLKEVIFPALQGRDATDKAIADFVRSAAEDWT